jgi:catechol 2,3-dioxygenase-like lactoylglutathione lyase family enzyme
MTERVRKSEARRWSRRQFGALLPAALAAPAALAQASGIRLIGLHCCELRVSDPAASLDFYQHLFGMPVQSRSGGRISLGVGDGPRFVALRPVQDGEAPAITQIGYSVMDFDLGRTLAALESVGFERIAAPAITDPGIEHRMRTWTRTRGGAEEVHFADDRGLIVQLSDPRYCGGTGPLGEVCRLEPAPEGRLQLADFNHFTVFCSDGAEANRFYQQTFGLSVQAYQGPGSPVTGIGDGKQFVMYAGGGGRGGAATPATIHHGSFNIRDFDLERVRATLTDYGLTPGDARSGPMSHYVSLRMPNRGGAEGGTPELYFTDPDGILLQMQHLSYCGGGGYLGNECLAG